MDAEILNKMRADWNGRAKENAQYYVQNEKEQWDRRDFFRSGEINVANEVMTDMVAICGGRRSPLDLRMLEIGCGVGRMTRMLARIFGHVTGVDISEEMIRQARENTADLDNVDLVVGDGCTLAGLPDASYDFAYSFIVFQHIPAYRVIASYCREVNRVLKPRGLFKFQVQGYTELKRNEDDTWLGHPVSAREAKRLAEESGFALERQEGAGTQWYWLWFRKP
ncbi:MAG TPA: class I SAM-dependent methyltransferase [Bryobacteraceae bacterium]|nr:class I SAM-dependent methyltransferase [Bryobacteraceae bacterium]